VQKNYWGYTGIVREEFQVNANGYKNGYYKEFNNEGELYKKGTYRNGKKTGVWTTYDTQWSGQIAATIEYSDGKMNGQYKQWCWESGRRYLCGDYVYIDDKEVRAKQYFSNGKLHYERDHEKGIYKEWFVDGSAKKETIDGKKYEFAWSRNGRKVVSMIFDSLEVSYMYLYSEYDDFNLKYLQILGEEEFYVRYNWMNLPDIGYKKRVDHGDNSKIPSMLIDSTYFRKAMLAYLQAPDPNNTRSEFIKYNADNGIASLMKKDSSYIELFFLASPAGRYEETRYDKTGNRIQYTLSDMSLSESIKNEPLITRYFESGTLREEVSNIDKSRKLYYPSGSMEIEYLYADEAKDRAGTTENQFYESGQLKLTSYKEKRDFSTLTITEKTFDEDGALRSDFFRDSNGYPVTLEYSEGGVLEKVTLNGTVKSDRIDVYAYQCDKLLEQFKSKYLISETAFRPSTGYTTSGYYTTYQYPRGEIVYNRCKKVIDRLNFDVLNSLNDESGSKALERYMAFINKLMMLEEDQTTSLEGVLKKVKKVEDIERLIMEL
jgi:antitoxin component YwqK of YwqJK toxin-antitoxin module